MNDLIPRERELVALGAAMASNCVPCVEYHIAESRRVGLTDAEIHAAIQHADKIRQVPARKTLQAALDLLPSETAHGRDAGTGEGCRGVSPAATKGETSQAAQPRHMMMGMMSKMMDACGARGQPASSQNSAATKPAAHSATNEGCGCS